MEIMYLFIEFINVAFVTNIYLPLHEQKRRKQSSQLFVIYNE